MNSWKTRDFRDRDFLNTKEGFFFCVIGPFHPDDRVISYLKYLPAPKGKWKNGQDRFRRVMQTYTIPDLLETFDILKTAFPKYLFFSPVYNITMTAAPRKDVVTHFRPEVKLAELIKKKQLDHLQNRAVQLVSLLSRLSSVPSHNFGITGSILLDIHNPDFSDIDIVIYGAENSYAVKEALEKTFSTRNDGVKRFDGEKLQEWYAHKTKNHPINLAEAKQIYERKWNIGVFNGTLFSVHPVKPEKELTEMYGDKTYHPTRIVTLQAIVTDSKDSIFLPAVYSVEDVEVEGGAQANIEEVVSYEGLYDSLAEKGETIQVKGKLEQVIDNRTGERYDRVLVGSTEGKGREYIKRLA